MVQSEGRVPRTLLLTRRGEPGLLGSYGRALERMGVEALYWDLGGAIDQAARFGRIGRRLNTLVPIAPWQARASRELILAAMGHRPDLILVGGTAQVMPGALGQIRAALPDVRLVLVWPDTLLNLGPQTIQALPLYDLVATYSERSMDPLRRLGAREVRWVPLAADPIFMPKDVAISDDQRREFSCDVGFIGNPRPERERAISALLKARLDVKVWGTRDWARRAVDADEARGYWQGRPLLGEDFVRATCCSRISLNVIDDTNYPAANMRFFEAAVCGATALVSPCPEMETEFPDDVAVVYFRSDEELVANARALLGDEDRRKRIAAEGHRRVLAGHTYEHRARDILEALGVTVP